MAESRDTSRLAMRIAALMVTPEGALGSFRKSGGELMARRLAKARSLLEAVAETLDDDDPVRWDRIDRALESMTRGAGFQRPAEAPVPAPERALSAEAARVHRVAPDTSAAPVVAQRSAPATSFAAAESASAALAAQPSGLVPPTTAPTLPSPDGVVPLPPAVVALPPMVSALAMPAPHVVTIDDASSRFVVPEAAGPEFQSTEVTGEMPAVVIETPLPFRHDLPSVEARGTRRAAARKRVPSSEVPGTVLPFVGCAENGGPPASGTAPASAALTLEQYASLSVERARWPNRAAEVLQRYGLQGEHALHAVEQGWQARFEAEPALRGTFRELCVQYVAWLDAHS